MEGVARRENRGQHRWEEANGHTFAPSIRVVKYCSHASSIEHTTACTTSTLAFWKHQYISVVLLVETNQEHVERFQKIPPRLSDGTPQRPSNNDEALNPVVGSWHVTRTDLESDLDLDTGLTVGRWTVSMLLRDSVVRSAARKKVCTKGRLTQC